MIGHFRKIKSEFGSFYNSLPADYGFVLVPPEGAFPGVAKGD